MTHLAAALAANLRAMSLEALRVPFSRPPDGTDAVAAVADAAASGHIKANGPYTRRCQEWMQRSMNARTVLMVQSCTSALELSAMLLDVGEGDEVIMPSFAFASSANAFVLRGATPVFVDVSPETLNIDERLIEAAITERTRAIVAVHYAGVGAEMEAICRVAEAHGLAVVEDAAQGICASYDGRALGTIGALGTISFDATKNLTSGSGGALVVNDPELAQRAEVLRDYGTDRARFVRGEIERYRWMAAGSNSAMNELAAAYLWPQLRDSASLTRQRRAAWQRYHDAFAPAEQAGLLRRPVVPPRCEHNGHIYYLLLPTRAERDGLLAALDAAGVDATFHYVPLHSAPAGLRYGRVHGTLSATDDVSARMVRLPLWSGMSSEAIDHVVAAVLDRIAGGGAPGSAAG